MENIDRSEITPEAVYSRRNFIMGAGALASASLLAAACRPGVTPPDGETPKDELTPPDAIANYTNYYEFTFDKEDATILARDFKTSPWTVTVGGLVNRPQTYDIEDLLRRFPQEERVYRMRCVEAWSMVIPWLGFPLSSLLKEAGPAPNAKYVRFEGVLRPEEMPGQKEGSFPWPYIEGLRLDEAMHSLTILATGIYGKPLSPQNGAPIRLVVPWKYGFKNIKAIVKIDLVEKQPDTFWMLISPGEYGFYANVNPEVPHPRWSQSSERRIGESGRRRTLMFNGYGDEVARLYQGMDLRQDF